MVVPPELLDRGHGWGLVFGTCAAGELDANTLAAQEKSEGPDSGKQRKTHRDSASLNISTVSGLEDCEHIVIHSI